MEYRPGAPDPSDDGEDLPDLPDPTGDWPHPTGDWADLAGDWAAPDDSPVFAWLPPEDRLWRHPSERSSGAPTLELATGPGGRRGTPARSRVLRSSWAIALIAGLIGATAATGVGVASGMLLQSRTVLRSTAASTPSISLAADGPQATDWTAIDDSASLSVVAVTVDGASGPAAGSGLIFSQSADGHTFVVTDRTIFARALADGYFGSIQVTYPTGESSQAVLVGSDALSGLAVLKVTSPASAVVSPADLGSVASLSDATAVLAVGSRSAPSLSPGLVSAQDRTVPLVDGTDMDGLLAVSMTAVSPSASGDPLLNQFGQVVGLTLGLQPASQTDQALTFAAPIDEVSLVATDIVEGVPVSHPWLGIADPIDVPSAMAHQMGLAGGVLAGTVSSTGPAARAGVRTHDIITSLDGQPVTSTGTLVAEVDRCLPGDAVPITYLHSGRTLTTTVTIANEPGTD